MKSNISIIISYLLILIWFAYSCDDKGSTVIPPAPDDQTGQNQNGNGDNGNGDNGDNGNSNGEPEDLVWVLDFEENFDGTAVDQTAWSMYHSAGHTGYGFRRASAFTVEDGLLVVTARMTTTTNNGRDTFALVSGGMTHRRTYTHAIFEFRVRTEECPSRVTSGVVLTWPASERWPHDGEMDIYETLQRNVNRNPFYTIIHYGASNSQVQHVHNVSAMEWHVIKLEWLKDKLRLYRNNVLVWTLTSPAAAIPDNPHKICIQLDAYAHQMNANSTVRMFVDWVKIHKQVPRAEKDNYPSWMEIVP